MIKLTLSVLLLLGFGCSTRPSAAPDRSPPPGTSPKGAVPSVEEAEKLLQQGDADGALALTDRILKADPDHTEARIVAARGNIALFQSGRQGAEWFLDDAVRNLEDVLNENPEDTRALLTLSWCRLRKSEFSSGRDLALEAADILRAKNAPSSEIADALMQAAEHEMQIFVDARRQEMADGVERPGDSVTDRANEVLATLTAAEQLGAGARARVRKSQVYQWMNKQTEALGELEAAVVAEPASAEANNALQQLYWGMDMRAECVAAYKRLLRSAPGTTALRWYLGRAQVALGDDLRTKTRWDDAEKAYSDALATFEAYDEARPGDHAGTAQWIAICQLSLGRVAFEQGRMDDAKERYFAAFDATPLVAETDENGVPRVYDSFGGNYLGGLSLIGQNLAEQTDRDALRRSLEFFEAIIQKHPGRFGTIYNNAALSARDLGVQVARSGAPRAEEAAADESERRARLEEAMALWEKSYAWYEQAVELEPDDPRIVNDCGLMLIYHLNRDYDRARELFDRAIELGEAQLAELPADASADQRNFLEEATGDAYQNIGVLLVDRLGRPAEEARPYFEKAVGFYPYQQREAARRLRALARQAAEQDPRKPKFDRAIEKGRKAAEAGDYDSALLVIDDLSKEMNGYAPFHYLAGLWSYRYAEKAAAEGGDAGLVDGLYQDAARHLRRAVELDSDPVEPRLALGRALLAIGESEEAANVATSLLSHVRSEGGASPEFLTQVHALRAQAAARAFVEKKQGGETDEDLLRTMRASFREIEGTDAFDQQKRSLWVASEQWAGAAEQAIQVLVRAWQRDHDLVGELVQTGAQLGASGKVVEALAGAEDATTLWYSGKAHFDLATQRWSSGDPAGALKALDAAIGMFERSLDENEGFRESCEQWIALCLGQKGIVQISQDDLEGAEQSLLAAVRKRPDVFTNDLGGGSSIKRGVLVLADRYFQDGDLGKTASIYRAVGAAVPGDVDIANNEGLFCRDHADALARRAGSSEQTKELYEASYAAYTRASELDPANVRLRNDRALILVYSLKRDLDLAERILKSAITDGQRQLDEDPPADADELRNLQEAVGDAYGNLGVLYVEQERFAEARTNLQKSLEYYPFRARAGTRLLQRLDSLEKEAAEKAAGKEGDKDGGE